MLIMEIKMGIQQLFLGRVVTIMIDQLIKNDPDKNPKGWFTYHKDEGEGDYYTANIIKTGFDNWINSGMKID